jgi:hypothetical protein
MPDLDVLALQVALALFGHDEIPDEAIPVVACAVIEACADLRVASVEEMIYVHHALCCALVMRDATRAGGVN